MDEERLQNRILELEEINEKLNTQIIDYQFELNYNKQTELIEFVRELYSDINKEISSNNKHLSKKELLQNLKEYIEDFCKYNKLKL